MEFGGPEYHPLGEGEEEGGYGNEEGYRGLTHTLWQLSVHRRGARGEGEHAGRDGVPGGRGGREWGASV